MVIPVIHGRDYTERKPTLFSVRDQFSLVELMDHDTHLERMMMMSTQCVRDTVELSMTKNHYSNKVNDFYNEFFEEKCIYGYQSEKCFSDNALQMLELLTPSCEVEGGTLHPVLFRQVCSGEYYYGWTVSYLETSTVCIAPTCDSLEDFVENLDYDAYYYSGDDDARMDRAPDSRNHVGCTNELDYYKGDDEFYCTEEREEEFVLNKQMKIRNCAWLSKQAMDKKEKYCTKDPPVEGYKSAMEACPKTCCTCGERSESEYFLKMDTNGDKKVPVFKTCEKVTLIDNNERKEKVCSKKKDFKGVPPAREACPHSCGTCPGSGYYDDQYY